jgi:uncharacterized protein
MQIMRILGIGLLAWTLLVSMPSRAESPEAMDWDALMPKDYNAEELFEKYHIESLEDGDPRADEFLRELKAAWKVAPVVEALAGRRVKLPGFVVPVETRGETVVEFFLVPYFGACIHVPPPPANQMVCVVMAEGKGLTPDQFNQAIWVSGRLAIQHTSNELGDAGYRMEGEGIEPYEK